MPRPRPRKPGKNDLNRPEAKRYPHPDRPAKPGKPGRFERSDKRDQPDKGRPAAGAPAPRSWNPPKRPPNPWDRPDGRNGRNSGNPWDRNPRRKDRPNLPKAMPRSTTPRPGAGGKGRPESSKGSSWGHSAPPSRARLEELLIGHGVQLPGATLDKVWQYHQILRRENHDLDLTRLIGFETIVQRHYADCMTLHKLMKGRWPSPLVDIGTGAGFPGMMIKIASPATEVILSEPRNVRVDFLNNTIKELGLKGISVFGHKFTSKSFTTPVRGAITRAFEPIAKTLPRLQNSLQIGGLAMFMKGPGVDEELSGPIPPGYKLVRDERYRIPKTTLDRAFVVFERVKGEE